MTEFIENNNKKLLWDLLLQNGAFNGCGFSAGGRFLKSEDLAIKQLLIFKAEVSARMPK